MNVTRKFSKHEIVSILFQKMIAEGSVVVTPGLSIGPVDISEIDVREYEDEPSESYLVSLSIEVGVEGGEV